MDGFELSNLEIIGNANLTDEAKSRLLNVKSANTTRAYSFDWNNFSVWCKNNGVQNLPATPETVVNYMNDLAKTLKANTISRHVTAISENHKAANMDNPAKSPIVQATMASIRREKGTHQEGKKPILLDTLLVMSRSFTNDFADIRNKALVMLGFAGAFRRSELVSIRFEDITFTKQGMVVFIPKSKTDQEGQGYKIGIPFSPDERICPVRATKAWLEASEIQSGYIFRGLKRNGTLKETHLGAGYVALFLKEALTKAGIDSTDYSAHSLRRGFTTMAARANVSVFNIMRQTRHKSEKMVHRYISEANVFMDNPLAMVYERK